MRQVVPNDDNAVEEKGNARGSAGAAEIAGVAGIVGIVGIVGMVGIVGNGRSDSRSGNDGGQPKSCCSGKNTTSSFMFLCAISSGCCPASLKKRLLPRSSS
jgi:hypothetical protein